MRRRLALLFSATTVLVVIAFVVPLSLVIRSDDREDQIMSVVSASNALAAFIDNQTPPSEIADAIIRFRVDRPGITVTVYGRDGTLIGRPLEANEFVEAAFAGQGSEQQAGGGVTVYVPNNGPFETDSASFYVIRVEASRDVINRGFSRLGFILVLSTSVAAIVGGLTGWIAARSISTPTRRLTETARRLQSGDLTARAAPAGPPELKELAETLNHMAARIDDLLLRERESGADIAHRLRTPFTALHLEIEALPESPERGRLEERAESLQDTLSQIIADMRSRESETTPISDLCAIATERLGRWARAAKQAGRPMEVTIAAESPRFVAASEEGLKEAINAVLSNAFTHTPPDAPLAAAVEDSDGIVRIVVEDGGSGFPDHAVAERGVSRGGSSGLGLDIVRRTVEGAGGTVEIDRSPALGGALVSLEFPRRDD